MKKCTKCSIEKPNKEFYKDRTKKSGYRPDCKKCNSKAASIYSKKNRDKCNDANMKYRTGVSKNEYDNFLELQNNGCAICHKTEKENNKRLSIDHCHRTNYIRGLLCNKCNQGLGYFEDNIELLNKAIDYLLNNLSNNKINYGKNIGCG